MSPSEAPEAAPGRRLLLELGPLVVFFVANAQLGIFWATGIFMVAISASVLASRFLEQRWPVMPLFTAVFVLVMGSLTLIFHDETFIKLKPTIVNTLFALMLFAGLGMGHALLKIAFGSAFALDEEGWRRLTVRWAWFFLVLAGLNEAVWRTTSTDTWVSFKVFGVMPLTMGFMITQLGLIKRHAIEPPGPDPRDTQLGDPE